MSMNSFFFFCLQLRKLIASFHDHWYTEIRGLETPSLPERESTSEGEGILFFPPNISSSLSLNLRRTQLFPVPRHLGRCHQVHGANSVGRFRHCRCVVTQVQFLFLFCCVFAFINFSNHSIIIVLCRRLREFERNKEAVRAEFSNLYGVVTGAAKLDLHRDENVAFRPSVRAKIFASSHKALALIGDCCVAQECCSTTSTRHHASCCDEPDEYWFVCSTSSHSHSLPLISTLLFSSRRICLRTTTITNILCSSSCFCIRSVGSVGETRA